MTVADLTPLLSPHEVGVRLAVSESTIRRLIRNGDLPFTRVGSQLRCDPDDLEAWLLARLNQRRTRGDQ